MTDDHQGTRMSLQFSQFLPSHSCYYEVFEDENMKKKTETKWGSRLEVKIKLQQSTYYIQIHSSGSVDVDYRVLCFSSYPVGDPFSDRAAKEGITQEVFEAAVTRCVARYRRIERIADSEPIVPVIESATLQKSFGPRGEITAHPTRSGFEYSNRTIKKKSKEFEVAVMLEMQS